MTSRLIFLSVLVSLWLASCSEIKRKEILIYDGPIREVSHAEHYYSEDDQVKIKLTADLVYEFENGDSEFPEGLYLEFYDEAGKVESTLSANHAYFYKQENKWRGQGKVEIKNIKKREQLNTEELFWFPREEKIETDQFVTIRQQSDVIYGNGLEAKQDLSTYRITEVTGTVHIDD